MTLSVVDQICADCGLSHEQGARLVRLKRMLPATAEDIYSTYPCTYPIRKGRNRQSNGQGSRMLFRDLQLLGARSDDGTWRLP
jgi:hypothetical protein